MAELWFDSAPWPSALTARMAACTADYTGEAVESETAIVVIVRGYSDLPSPRPTGPIFCPAIGYARTVTVSLSEPLGDRTVLDHWSG